MRTAIDVVLAKPTRTAAQLETLAERVRRAVDRAELVVDALLTLAVSDQGTEDVEPLDLATARRGRPRRCEQCDARAEGLAGRSGARAGRGEREPPAPGTPGRQPGRQRSRPQRPRRMGAGALGVRRTDTPSWKWPTVGPRVPADLVPHLFEPFRRAEGTDRVLGRGTGPLHRAVGERGPRRPGRGTPGRSGGSRRHSHDAGPVGGRRSALERPLPGGLPVSERGPILVDRLAGGRGL